MARKLGRLTARTVATLTKPGRHADGGNLYLAIDQSGARRWVFMFRWEGRQREMGLGGLKSVSLARARELAAEARATLAQGFSPIERKRTESSVPTFGEVANDLVASMSSQWRNAKHAAQWTSTLAQHAASLGPIPIDKVTTEHILAVLKPIWQKVPETASRLRGRIERVMSAGRALGHVSGPNPAAWRGHLADLLPARQRLTRGHHRALDWRQVPGFMEQLRARPAIAALALEFTALTASRTSEVLGMSWAEVDLQERTWSVPPARMKSGRSHRVPLSNRAVAILEEMLPLKSGVTAPVFPGPRKGRPLSSMALLMLLRRMDAPTTTHGLRSCFKDWAAEATSYANELSEAALAHVIADKTEAAYRRGDLFERRRSMMQAWSDFCAGETSAKVVALLGGLNVNAR
jgi:integrase